MNSGFSLKCGIMHCTTLYQTTLCSLVPRLSLLCEIFARTIFELKPTHGYIERGHSIIQFKHVRLEDAAHLGMRLYTTLIVILCNVIAMWSHC